MTLSGQVERGTKMNEYFCKAIEYDCEQFCLMLRSLDSGYRRLSTIEAQAAQSILWNFLETMCDLEIIEDYDFNKMSELVRKGGNNDKRRS